MNSDAPSRRLTDIDEIIQNPIARSAAIDEIQIAVIETGTYKPPRIVCTLIQAHNCGDFVPTKVGEVRLWRMYRIAFV